MRTLTIALLILTALSCGSDHHSDKPVMSVTLPATLEGGVIKSQGVILGDAECSTMWLAEMRFENVDGIATLNGSPVTAVEVKPNTWSYSYDRVELEVIETTTFTLTDNQVTVSLSCNFYGPKEGSN